MFMLFYCQMGVMGMMEMMGDLGIMGAAQNGGSKFFTLPSSLFILPLNYITFISSTSNTSAEYGGIDCPAPDSP